MSDSVRFIDQTGKAPSKIDLWPAVVIAKETIDAEIERLANLPKPANGCRRSVIAHPANQPSTGLAPGIGLALGVLLPGERTVPDRQDSAPVHFVIRGQGASARRGQPFGREG